MSGDAPAVYVDELLVYPNARGPFRAGSCHMFALPEHADALHALAARIGLKRSWFQDDRDAGHYDLTKGKRVAAVATGAVEVGRAEAVAIWRASRVVLPAAEPMPCVYCVEEPNGVLPCPCSHAPCVHREASS